MKVVCISARARCGKDTAADYMKTELEKKGYRVLIAHYADLVKFVAENYLDCPKEKNEQTRSVYQQVGTNIVREQNPNFWVDFVATMIILFKNKGYEWDYVLIPDTRFPNEIERMKEKGFDVTSVRINRVNFENDLTETQRAHSSETSMDNYPFDHYIVNDTLEGFYSRLSEFIGNVLVHNENKEIQAS